MVTLNRTVGLKNPSFIPPPLKKKPDDLYLRLPLEFFVEDHHWLDGQRRSGLELADIETVQEKDLKKGKK